MPHQTTGVAFRVPWRQVTRRSPDRHGRTASAWPSQRLRVIAALQPTAPGGPELEANPEISSRVEGRLERLGLSAEDADRQAGLPPGTVAAIVRQSGGLPRGTALRRLVAILDVSEEFILGLEPGDIIPADMLEDPQGELGLLAPDEEALLRNYRRLDIPTRAAVVHLVSRAAGPEPEPEAAKQVGRGRGRDRKR
jgi:hypothetical protein